MVCIAAKKFNKQLDNVDLLYKTAVSVDRIGSQNCYDTESTNSQRHQQYLHQ